MDQINIMVVEDDKDLAELIRLYLMPEEWNIIYYRSELSIVGSLKVLER